MNKQITDIDIWRVLGNAYDLVELLIQTVLFLSVETENRRAVKYGEDLLVAGSAKIHLLWQHKANDNAVAGRSGQIF